MFRLSSFLLLIFVSLHLLYDIGSCDDDGEKFSVDSDDSGDGASASVDESTTYNGFGVRVYQESGNPTLVFYNSKDSTHTQYCLEFDTSFETSDYNCTSDDEDDVDENEIDNSEIEFSSLDWTYEECDSATEDCIYRFFASSDKWAELRFTLNVIEGTDSVGDPEYYVKFNVLLDDYIWTNTESDDYWVLQFHVSDCSSSYDESGSVSGDGDDDDDDDEGDDDVADDDDEEIRRLRRLLEDSTPEPTSDSGGDSGGDDDDGDDSSSSSDSAEFDFNAAYFRISETANDGNVTVCMNPFQDTSEGSGEFAIHVVYSHFDSDLEQDPWVGVDNDEITEDTSNSSGFYLSVKWIFAIVMIVGMFN